MDNNSYVRSSRAQSSHQRLNHYYCKIPGCQATLAPYNTGHDIAEHVSAEHPDILIRGSVGDISFKFRGKKSGSIKKLVIAHGKVFWVILNYSVSAKRLVCESVMLDRDEDSKPTHSVAIKLCGFGHEILLDQKFGIINHRRTYDGHRPLNYPVTQDELSRMVNANNRILALVCVMKRYKQKISGIPSDRNQTYVIRPTNIMQIASQLGTSISPVYCVIGSCGMNMDFGDMIRHFKENHPDQFVCGKVGDMSMTLQLYERDEILFKLINTYGEIFLVMVAYWHQNVQLQFASFMKFIPKKKSYITNFRMSKRSAYVGQTLFKKLLNGKYKEPLNMKTFAVLTGEKVKDMINGEGQLKIAVKIKINSYQDVP